MLTRSTKSVRSIRSLSSVEDNSTATSSCVGARMPSAFEELLPYVCKKFNCDFDLFVKKEICRDSVGRYKKSDAPVKCKHTDLLSSRNSSPRLDDAKVITMISVYDNDRLIEIFMYNQKIVPRLLMQAINTISSLYEDVNKITIRNCNVDGYTIYELNKLLTITFLTDVCLDDSFVQEGNYYILLDKGTTLKHLSLCRCFISDVACRKIVSKLQFPSLAEKNLLVLNLSGNCITDQGAKSIALMLRSNRHLRYLNLAGNRINDEGASGILDSLKEFSLTFDEINEKRTRMFAYLKRRNELTKKFMSECDMQIISSNIGFSSDSLRTMGMNLDTGEDEAHSRAKMLAIQLMGKLQEPFYSNNILIKDGWSYCTGNMTLSYLNLSYNNLTHLSVNKVLGVLRYQSSSDFGLLKIILEGNPAPKICPEYGEISALINKKLTIHIVKEPINKRKRVSRISGKLLQK